MASNRPISMASQLFERQKVVPRTAMKRAVHEYLDELDREEELEDEQQNAIDSKAKRSKLKQEAIDTVLKDFENDANLDRFKTEYIADMLIEQLGADTVDKIANSAMVLARESDATVDPKLKVPRIDRMYKCAWDKVQARKAGLVK